jgi:hypothetical protein
MFSHHLEVSDVEFDANVVDASIRRNASCSSNDRLARNRRRQIAGLFRNRNIGFVENRTETEIKFTLTTSMQK